MSVMIMKHLQTKMKAKTKIEQNNSDDISFAGERKQNELASGLDAAQRGRNTD